jgi:hypothetical protein
MDGVWRQYRLPPGIELETLKPFQNLRHLSNEYLPVVSSKWLSNEVQAPGT